MSTSYWGQFRSTREADLTDARDEYEREAAQGDEEALLAFDLIDVFFASKGPRKAAGRLPPHNFRRELGSMLANARTSVRVAEMMVRDQTEGFDIVAAINRPDLAVEVLVADTRKPYHHLFSAEAIAVSASRLRSVGFNPPWLA